MQTCHSIWVRRGGLACALIVAGVLLLAAREADAHFILQTPPSWWSQDGVGGPQKQGPCGNANPGETAGSASDIVTPIVFAPGAPRTINITVDETIGHPGHYRVALAQTQATLPAEPIVTPSASDPCASAAIQPATTTPTLPAVLGDNLSPKTTSRRGVQNFSVTVPEGLTCTNCTLQVIEFMSSHALNVPGGCYYHHCANITIQNGGPGTGGTAGGTGGTAGRAGGTGGAAGQTGNGTGGAVAASGGGSHASGGATSSGGNTGTGGAVVAGTGGSSAGTGGRAASGSGGGPAVADASVGGAAGSGGPAASDGGGCSCEVVAVRSLTRTAVVGLGVGLGLGALLHGRRRRRR